MEKQNSETKRDRIGMIVYVIYLFLLLASLLLIGKIIYMQIVWKPENKIAVPLRPKNTRKVLEPVRGNILDCKGRLLAMSYPVYYIHMDCTVGKEDEWHEKAKALAQELPSVFPGRTADQYYQMMKQGRKNGQRYLAIGGQIDHKTLNKVRTFPLFRDGKNRGGLIVEQKNTRKYPYGSLARRTIGFVRGSNPGVSNNLVGLEGKYNDVLHGKDGNEWFRQADKGKIVRNFDSLYVKPEDGKDIITTINIDYQEIANDALMAQIDGNDDIEGACLVLMEVKTGAIRAMVNLKKNRLNGKFEEIENMAIGRRHEPGSVFKTVTLVSVLQDGYIDSLDVLIPTNHGIIREARVNDQHIRDHENQDHVKTISVIDGFKISSNYVFAKLALDYYGSDKEKLMNHMKEFGLSEGFEFDLDGLQKPNIPFPEHASDLARVGYGYATEVTPIHVLAFYNAIAGKGRMMKPYLVDGPTVLRSSICSKAVADTLTRALKAVTEDGTAKWSLLGCKVAVAGKTGTSFGTFPKGQRGADPYHDPGGRRKYQGTFAGYFPADDPQYSVISTVYSYPTIRSYQGGGIPARAIKALIDRLYTIDPYWQKNIENIEACDSEKQ